MAALVAASAAFFSIEENDLVTEALAAKPSTLASNEAAPTRDPTIIFFISISLLGLKKSVRTYQ